MLSLFRSKKHRTVTLFRALFSLLILSSLVFIPLAAKATSSDELIAEAEERKKKKVETNDIPGWPQGPAISAESAVLFDVDSKTVLYGKNIHEKLFPASTTKLLTCILVAENCNMDELVTISQTAIDNRGRNGSNMALVAGEQLTVEELLHGVLISSANEACNALAEHVAGSIEEFVVMMNQRAAELGCTDCNFVTPHGYHDENHYCSAYDLALIGEEFFKHEELSRISLLLSYHIEEDDGHPHGEHYLGSHNKMLPGCSYHYEGLLGSKTGYTDVARQTLVSCAENNGLRLICVIMKEESPDQFADTNTLFAYGFNNFTSYKISEQEERFHVGKTDFFNSSSDIFGSTKPILSVKDKSSVLLPNGASFEDTETSLVYGGENDSAIAYIQYTYHGALVGNGEIIYNDSAETISYTNELPENQKAKDRPIFINVKKVFLALFITVAIIVAVFFILTRIRRFVLDPTRASNIKKRRSGSTGPRNHARPSPRATSPSESRSTSSIRIKRRPQTQSPEDAKARKERELLAARRASKAEIASRQKTVQTITRESAVQKTNPNQIDTYRLKDSEMTTGYAKKPLSQEGNSPRKKPAQASQNTAQKKPVQQVRRTSYSSMYRVGTPTRDDS